MESIISVNKLTRLFRIKDKERPRRGWFAPPSMKDVVAVRDLDFCIGAGEKVAFIGPNGAGKSTTLKMLSGLLFPTSGAAHVCGLVPWDEPKALARRIGLVFGQRSHLWPHLSVKESFALLAAIYDLDETAARRQTEKLIDVFGLSKFLGQPARTLSLGQRMRCDIAAALLHQPSVLFLDEPTIGLDVTAKALLRDHLNRLVQEFETTVLLTSHDTDDIEKICERVILIDRGQKLLDTTLDALRRDYRKSKTLRLATEEVCPLFTHPHVVVEAQGEHVLVLSVDVTQVRMESVVAQCLERFTIHDITIEDMPLEEIIKEIYRRMKEGKNARAD